MALIIGRNGTIFIQGAFFQKIGRIPQKPRLLRAQRGQQATAPTLHARANQKTRRNETENSTKKGNLIPKQGASKAQI